MHSGLRLHIFILRPVRTTCEQFLLRTNMEQQRASYLSKKQMFTCVKRSSSVSWLKGPGARPRNPGPEAWLQHVFTPTGNSAQTQRHYYRLNTVFIFFSMWEVIEGRKPENSKKTLFGRREKPTHAVTKSQAWTQDRGGVRLLPAAPLGCSLNDSGGLSRMDGITFHTSLRAWCGMKWFLFQQHTLVRRTIKITSETPPPSHPPSRN